MELIDLNAPLNLIIMSLHTQHVYTWPLIAALLLLADSCTLAHQLSSPQPAHAASARADAGLRTVKPNWNPCLEGSPGASMPFCNHTKPIATRVADMISHMSDSEKISQLYDKMGAVPSLGWQG